MLIVTRVINGDAFNCDLYSESNKAVISEKLVLFYSYT